MRKGRLLLWGFRSAQDLVWESLGPLERQVLEVVWNRGAVTVRDVSARLDPAVAYTTAMTTMDRLYKKGLLARAKPTRAFVYSATSTREELEHIVATDLIAGMLARRWPSPLPFLSNLVEEVGNRDRAMLDELERLVKIKLRGLAKNDAP